MTGNINIGSKLPDGHTSQPGGFSSRSPAAGLATGVSGRGGIGSVKDGLDNPVIKTGSGAQMQGQDSGEQTNQKPNEITFTKEEGEADYHISRANEAAEDAQFQIDFTAPEVEGEGEIDESDHTGTKSQPPPGFFDPSSERTVEGDPGDGNKKGNYANTDKVKDIFGGVRFAPDEEPTTGGTIDPELLQSIQSSKTQVNFVDGVDLNSNNFEDLSEQAQQAVKNRGQGNPVSN